MTFVELYAGSAAVSLLATTGVSPPGVPPPPNAGSGGVTGTFARRMADSPCLALPSPQRMARVSGRHGLAEDEPPRPGCVVYLDPPYSGTAIRGYYSGGCDALGTARAWVEAGSMVRYDAAMSTPSERLIRLLDRLERGTMTRAEILRLRLDAPAETALERGLIRVDEDYDDIEITPGGTAALAAAREDAARAHADARSKRVERNTAARAAHRRSNHEQRRQLRDEG